MMTSRIPGPPFRPAPVLNRATRPILLHHARTPEATLQPLGRGALLTASRRRVVGAHHGEQQGADRRGRVQGGSKVTEAIDDAALVLTGRRDHFWLKPH